ncbi:MAG: hypothetical protein HC842_03235 [Cytophagales bacterium]|nr:hypothetical protein [Cytophagales bacterium]
MKTWTLTLFAFLLGAGSLMAQTIRLVNNTPGKPAGALVYNSVQEAHDAANPGDIVHVMPSALAHTNLTLSKPIRIYGIGFNPDKDGPQTCLITNVFFQAGASNVVLAGLEIALVRLAKCQHRLGHQYLHREMPHRYH